MPTPHNQHSERASIYSGRGSLPRRTASSLKPSYLAIPGIVLLACCLAASADDQQPGPSWPGKPQARSTRKKTDPARAAEQLNRNRTQAILRQLKTPVKSVRFESTPLAEVLDWFKAQGLTNLLVSWKVLENAGEIARDTPVTVALEGLPLGEVLDHVLAQASSQTRLEQDQLTYHVFDGVLHISSRVEFDRQVYTRMYYVEDLLYPITLNELLPYLQIGQEFAYVSELDPEVAGGAVAQRPVIDVIESGVRHGPGDPGYGNPDFKAVREAGLEDLIGLLKTIRPPTWVEGGGKGTISAFGEKLVINQTIEMHEIIGGAFHKVRTGPAKQQQKP